MSAELLRAAAGQMRFDAESVKRLRWAVVAKDTAQAEVFIAAWHPAVALAVADWLDAAAEDEQWFARHRHSTFGYTGENPAFAVARAYLGRQP